MGAETLLGRVACGSGVCPPADNHPHTHRPQEPTPPSWGRALASAGFVIYAGHHRDMPCTIRLSRLNNIHRGNRQNTSKRSHAECKLSAAGNLWNRSAESHNCCVVIEKGSLGPPKLLRDKCSMVHVLGLRLHSVAMLTIQMRNLVQSSSTCDFLTCLQIWQPS